MTLTGTHAYKIHIFSALLSLSSSSHQHHLSLISRRLSTSLSPHSLPLTPTQTKLYQSKCPLLVMQNTLASLLLLLLLVDVHFIPPPPFSSCLLGRVSEARYPCSCSTAFPCLPCTFFRVAKAVSRDSFCCLMAAASQKNAHRERYVVA